jgi:hypothetical protein
MAKMKPMEELAQEICWLGFHQPKTVGVSKSQYWKQITESSRKHYREEAERFVFYFGKLSLGMLLVVDRELCRRMKKAETKK